MRNGTTNWDVLDDGFGVVGNGDVEYVGVIEEESTVPMGSNGVSNGRQRVPVGRRNPLPNQRRQQVRHPVPEPVTDSIRVATANGEVTLNQDAIRAAARSPVQQMGGQTVRRAAPGTYLVMKPSQAERMQGMGGGFDVGGLVSGILGAGTQITGTVLQYQQSQTAARYEAEARRAAAQAALEEAATARRTEAEARRAAAEQAQRDFELQMERARALRAAGREAAAQQQREAAAQQREQRLPAAQAAAGTSPIVWVVVALLGAGAIGAVVWGVTRKKDKE